MHKKPLKVIRFLSTKYFLRAVLFSGTNTSHALVDFGDDGTEIVPFARVIEDTVCSRCRVLWSDRKEYEADVIFAGIS